MLLSDDETSAYFMAWGRHFSQNLLEDLPPGTCMDLRLLTFGNSQQTNYELLMRMTLQQVSLINTRTPLIKVRHDLQVLTPLRM